MKGVPNMSLAEATRVINARIENVERSLYGRTRAQLGASLEENPNRDLYEDCGYPRVVTAELCKEMILREGAADRANAIYPDECFAVDPEAYESEDENVTTDWEKWFDEFKARQAPWHDLHLLDLVSGKGQYGASFLGFDDLSKGRNTTMPVLGLNDQGKPARGRPTTDPRKLLYVRAFDQTMISIDEIDEDPGSERCGQPTMYSFRLFEPQAGGAAPERSSTKKPPLGTYRVHWTRVLPAADNRTTSPIFGTPRLTPIYNRLVDLRKIYGGSAEMFWKGAFPGFVLEALPDVTDDADLDMDSVKEQMGDYFNRLQRYISLVGMTMKPLTPQMADPTAHVEVLLAAIAYTLGVPTRIFKGSEAAHLASSQDISTWNKRLAKRQKTYLTPKLIMPFLERLILVGVAPPTKEPIKIDWTDLNSLSEEAQANVSLKTTQALLQYVSSGAEKIMPLEFYLSHVLKYSRKLCQAILKKVRKGGDDFTKKVWDQPKPLPGTGQKSATKKTGQNRNSVKKPKK